MARLKVSRKTRSMMFANIILDNGLFNDWCVYRYNHPKIKSDYRLANLFLINKKLRWYVPDILHTEVNMSNLREYYYES